MNEPYVDDGTVRKFDSGATRDTAQDKLDYEGFLNPMVLRHFAEYMHQHRKQSDGSLRDSDNWQKGIPVDVYMKSMTRHFMDLWISRRGGGSIDFELECLDALMFNVQGMMLELLKERERIFTQAISGSLEDAYDEIEAGSDGELG